MSIDGADIIGSDSAYDIHNFIIEGWKDGKPIADLLTEVRGWEKDFCFNARETEIYWTALAFSLWKIGQLPDDVRDKALHLIAKGACADWLEIDPKAPKDRQKYLDKLAKKISGPNLRPLARPKLPKTLKQPFFAIGDVVAVALPDGQYSACILVQLDQTPRKIEYNFAIVNLMQSTLPTLDDVANAEISAKGISKASDACWFCASCWTNHKTVGQVLPHLQRIGQVELKPGGMGCYAPGLGVDGFFRCWDSYFMSQNCHPMKDCIKKIVSEGAVKSA